MMKQNSVKMKKCRGITLLELLIAISIIVSLGGSLLVIRVRFLDSVKKAVKETVSLGKIARAQRFFSKDLENCFCMQQKDHDAKKTSCGFSGTKDMMTFYTLNPASDNPYGRAGKKSIYSAQYYIKEGIGYTPGLTLFRTVSGLSINDKKTSQKVMKGLERISFKYFSGKDWLDSWDKDYLPKAVTVDISVINSKEKLHSFFLVFDIPCGGEGDN